MLAPNIYDTKASVHIADMIYMIEHDKIPDDSDYVRNAIELVNVHLLTHCFLVWLMARQT